MRQALLEAARALTTPERSPTLLELAVHAQVGFKAARHTVTNMRVAGDLVIVRKRVVPYRNRPVAEYSTPRALKRVGVEPCPLSDVFANWATAIV